jgi:hypothetical protein
MINKLTYKEVNKYLLSIGNIDAVVEDIYIKYLERNKYIEQTNDPND